MVYLQPICWIKALKQSERFQKLQVLGERETCVGCFSEALGPTILAPDLWGWYDQIPLEL